MIPVEILTHSSDALNRRLEQFKKTENIKKILDIYLPQIQELEEIIHDMLLNRMDVNTAIGQQLDELGFIVDEQRQGKSDADYRKSIIIKIGINTSKGDPEKVISIFKLLTDSVFVHYLNLGGAELELETTTEFVDQDEVNFIFDNVHRFVSAGVRVGEIRCVDPILAFGFAGIDDNPTFKGFDEGCLAIPHRRGLEFAFATTDPNESDDLRTEGFGSHFDPLIGGNFI